MNKPNIPYNRAPKICEMIDHLKYLIEQKKLFEDDIIIGIINHTTKRETEGKEQDYNYQDILFRRRDRPLVIPQCPNDDPNKDEEFNNFFFVGGDDWIKNEKESISKEKKNKIKLFLKTIFRHNLFVSFHMYFFYYLNLI